MNSSELSSAVLRELRASPHGQLTLRSLCEQLAARGIGEGAPCIMRTIGELHGAGEIGYFHRASRSGSLPITLLWLPN